MKSGADVLNEILNELNLKAPTLAKTIGLPHYRLSDIQAGRVKKISGEIARAINKEYPQYSIDYLLTGEKNSLSNDVSGNNNVIGKNNKVNDISAINKLVEELALRNRQIDTLIQIVKEQMEIIKNK